MAVDLQRLMNSSSAVRGLSILSRVLPARLAYPICDLVADQIASRRDAGLTRAVRCNQWVARGAKLSKEALQQAVRETLRNNARDMYHLYHDLQRPDAVHQMICMSREVCEILERSEFAERGLIVLGLHLSNFDFVLRSIIQQGFQAMVLTIPNPQGGRNVEYEMRKRMGMNIVPASVGALRGAIHHLENGGTLVTGLDRPIPHPKHQPLFFGRPASLPIHYVSLASKAGVPIVVMAAIQQEDDKYHVFRSGFIECDPKQDDVQNAERVLQQAEHFIRLAPQQWSVPLPVWPQCLDEIELL
jgi:lauroyl/myristoyl acyltransferase